MSDNGRVARRKAATMYQPWDHRASVHWLTPVVIAGVHLRDIATELAPYYCEIDGLGELAVSPGSGLVGVFFSGHLVGYLDESTSDAYAPYLEKIESSGLAIAVRCWGGWTLDGGEMSESYGGGIRVQLPEPHRLVPMNGPPLTKHLMLPPGPRIEVTREEDYFDAIKPWISGRGESDVFATLHVVTEHRSRSAVEIVEVRIEDEVVGVLTDRMSAQIRPVVTEFSRLGLVTACRASVEGSAFGADVLVFPIRRSKISNDWLRAELSSLGIGADLSS